MAEEQNTSPENGATPNAGTPETGTPNASHGATPETKPTLSLEEVQKRYADLEKTHNNAKEELERHRKNAKKLADYEKHEQEAKDAALSEVEKANKRATDAESKIQHFQQQLVTAQVKLAAQTKGIIDPDLAALAMQKDLELDSDGMPTNLDTVLDALIKSKPYLLKPVETPAPEPTTPPAPPTPAKQAPTLPPNNPGRANIASPNANPQGTKFTPPSWSDAYQR